jgi:tetratricopeptide (TPR) repeat protein
VPGNKRQQLTDVFSEALEKIGCPVNRREFLKLAGFTSASLSAASSPLQLQPVEIPGAGSQEKLFQDKPHEECAEILNRRQEWQLAATFWLLAAQEAKQYSDWTKWSRCLLNAGLMALNCGQFEIAERRFKEVINISQHEVGMLAIAEAHIRLGWVYYEQDKFSQARQVLLKSRALLQNLESKDPRSLHLSEHGCTLVYCEGKELIVALESTRLHWLGRTYVDWGIEQDNQAFIKEGLAKLQKAGNYDSTLGLHPNVGFALLRQVPALLYKGELKSTENYIARSEELLGTRGTARGHIYLHKGMLALEEHPEKAKDFLESARDGFVEPTFYPRGLSEALKEISGIYLMDDRKSGDELALRYALATAVLHPYGRNVELLQLAAHKMYWRMGENLTAFNKFWQALEEKLWSMESEPFSDLKYLMKSFQENGIHHVETGIEVAKKAVHNELFRK